jgi:hypothetical protein
MSRFILMTSKPANTCLKESCNNCKIISKLNCHFNYGQLLRFYLIVLPSFIIGAIVIYKYAFLDLIIWLIIIAIFFLIVEIRVLCSHCPHYSKSSGTLRCWANFGAPKLWKDRPGPMNNFERTILILGFIIVWGYPIIFAFKIKDWLLLSIYVLSVVLFFTLLRQFFCKKCVNFFCPLNIVSTEIIDEFYNK